MDLLTKFCFRLKFNQKDLIFDWTIEIHHENFLLKLGRKRMLLPIVPSCILFRLPLRLILVFRFLKSTTSLWNLSKFIQFIDISFLVVLFTYFNSIYSSTNKIIYAFCNESSLNCMIFFSLNVLSFVAFKRKRKT